MAGSGGVAEVDGDVRGVEEADGVDASPFLLAPEERPGILARQFLVVFCCCVISWRCCEMQLGCSLVGRITSVLYTVVWFGHELVRCCSAISNVSKDVW